MKFFTYEITYNFTYEKSQTNTVASEPWYLKFNSYKKAIAVL